MYSKILKKLNIDTKLKITSFGCGPMIDYWSLCNACEEHSFEYIGIDIIDWNYKFESQNPNTYRFIKENMIEYIKQVKVGRLPTGSHQTAEPTVMRFYSMSKIRI